MRKICITLFSSVLMLAMAYVPFMATFTVVPSPSVIRTAHADTTGKLYCFYWNKKGSTDQREECSVSQMGCESAQSTISDENGANNIDMTSCQYVVPKSDIYKSLAGSASSNTTDSSSRSGSSNTNTTQQPTNNQTVATGATNPSGSQDPINVSSGTQDPTNNPSGTQDPTNNPSGTQDPGDYPSGTQDAPTGCGPTQLCNPLKYDTLCKLLEAILRIVTEVGAIIAVLLIIWNGFQFIVAQGNASKLTAARKALVTTLIGTAILLGASAIAQITIQTVLTITNQNNPGVCSL